MLSLTVNSGGVLLLSQKEFAKRLTFVMDEVWRGRTAKDIAEAGGIHPTTLSRWRNPNYEPGPPSQKDLGDLERALGMGYGELLSDAKGWTRAVNSLRNRAIGSRLGRVGEPNGTYEADGPVEGPGWDWAEDPDEGEDRLRTFLRNIDRTARGMVTSDATINAIRLAATQAMIKERVDKGLPIPLPLTRVYDELREGRFK